MLLAPNSPALNRIIQQHNIVTAISRLEELKSKLVPQVPEEFHELPECIAYDDEIERPCGRDSTIPFDIGSPEQYNEDNFFVDITEEPSINKFGTNQPSPGAVPGEKSLGDFTMHHICTDFPLGNTTQYFTHLTN